jgi:hypothetical protein
MPQLTGGQRAAVTTIYMQQISLRREQTTETKAEIRTSINNIDNRIENAMATIAANLGISDQQILDRMALIIEARGGRD